MRMFYNDTVIDFVHKNLGMDYEESKRYCKGLEILLIWTEAILAYSLVAMMLGVIGSTDGSGPIVYKVGMVYYLIRGVAGYCKTVWPRDRTKRKSGGQGGNENG